MISHKHKFIFLKTGKTAGTSVEIALSKFCGANDIVTKISEADEETRKSLGYTGAQNYSGNISPALKWLRSRLGKAEPTTFYNHMPATDIRALISQEIWDGYFKFCIERNPWDKTVSYYYWKNRSEPRPSMIDWLNKGGHKTLQDRGRQLYTIDDNIVVDQVIKYENLTDDLETVRLKIGLPEPLELPNAKSGVRKDKRRYQEIFSDEERQIIAKDFAYEIRTFGYAF
ncbi:MAG: sulfotransferase family 2 domain-containing protein [Rhodobacteraceae bacterium]|nr:sulfotransferase family 2 domain-containing protein [Paracoccaceae bacterium]